MKPNTDSVIIENSYAFTLENGVVRRKNNPEKVVGHYDKSSGYCKVKISGRSVLLHRLIFYLAYGHLPTYIDHIDRNKVNNLPTNLRGCTKSLNVVNSQVRSDNKHGYKGVTYHKLTSKYMAQTFHNGKRVYIGLFDTVEEAAKAYNLKAVELFGDYAVINNVEKE